MAAWQDNAIMYWNGNKITDHGRSTLNITNTQIGNDQRTANGTMRRQQVAVKRTYSASWDMIPSKSTVGGIQTADGGWTADQMEAFAKSSTGLGAFRMILRSGSASGKTAPTVTDAQIPYEDTDFEIVRVMITDFSSEVVKRGIKTDLVNVSVTLEEV